MADTIHWQNIKHANSHYAYVLVVVDCFTRKWWARALKNIVSTSMIDAFQSIFDSLGPSGEQNCPTHLITDGGKEFFNAPMKKFFEGYNVNHFTTPTKTPNKASMAERSIRTLKNRLSRHMQMYGTKRWVDVLVDVVRNYNATPHASLPNHMSPDDVANSVANQSDVYHKSLVASSKRRAALRRPRLHVADVVRILRPKKTFEKGYTQTWSDQLYKVERVIEGDPTVYYKISRVTHDDGDGNEQSSRETRRRPLMPGIYYYHQLNLVSRATDYGAAHTL